MPSCFVVHCAEPSPAPEHYSFPRGRCKTDRFPGPCRTMANRVWGVRRGPGKGSTLPALPLLPVFVRWLCPRPLSAGWVHGLFPLVVSTSCVCPLVVSTLCLCPLVVSTSCVCPLVGFTAFVRWLCPRYVFVRWLCPRYVFVRWLCPRHVFVRWLGSRPLSAGCVHVMSLSAGCVHVMCLSAGCVRVICLSAGCVHVMCLSAGCVHVMSLSAGCVHVMCLSDGCVRVMSLSAGCVRVMCLSTRCLGGKLNCTANALKHPIFENFPEKKAQEKKDRRTRRRETNTRSRKKGEEEIEPVKDFTGSEEKRSRTSHSSYKTARYEGCSGNEKLDLSLSHFWILDWRGVSTRGCEGKVICLPLLTLSTGIDRNRFPLHSFSSDNYFQPNPILNQQEIFSVGRTISFQSNFQPM